MPIRVSNLKKNYGEQTAVNNLSFSVDKGEILGFLGPNGAGKSTTMKMITGFLQPDGGEIEVSGINVKTSPLEARKRIGYLPEANPLYHDMYVREYLEFIAGIHQLNPVKPAVDKAVHITGLNPEAHKKIGQLSKGYKQRVGLAAALIHDPEVLILDEPTSGLDPNQIIEIRELIRELGKDKTVLFSSHILQEVEALCQRVVIINKGSIVADDQLKNLGASQLTNKLRVQFREPLEEEWLKRLPAVKSTDRKNSTTWVLETDHPEELNKQLMSMALQHNLNIVSLQLESKDLEAIFRSLTKEGNLPSTK